MSQCFDLNISISESYLASAHFDGAIRIWSLRSNELMHEVKNAHDNVVSCVKFTPDEKYFVSTGT